MSLNFIKGSTGWVIYGDIDLYIGIFIPSNWVFWFLSNSDYFYILQWYSSNYMTEINANRHQLYNINRLRSRIIIAMSNITIRNQFDCKIPYYHSFKTSNLILIIYHFVNTTQVLFNEVPHSWWKLVYLLINSIVVFKAYYFLSNRLFWFFRKEDQLVFYNDNFQIYEIN